jgi:hypothetical protein
MMPRLDVKDTLEFVGVVAIVASLVFVAIELRQSNQIGRLEAMQSMASDWSSVGLQLATDEDLAALLAQVYEGAVPTDFDPAQNVQINNVLHGLDHHWEMRFNQMKLGVLEPEDYSYPRPKNTLFSSDYHREVWPGLRPGFSEDFAIFWEKRFQLVRE